MRILGVFAVLVGGLELLNTIAAAGAVSRGGGSGTGALLALAAGLVSAMLLVAGGALIARPRGAIGFARIAALAGLLVFAILAAMRPGFSMASMLLGIIFPLIMLLVLLRRSDAASISPAR